MSIESRAGLLSFLAAWATLFAQVAVHRIVSAKMLNNYAFFILSLTMLGFAASGAWLARRPERVSNWSPHLLSAGSCLFGLGLVVATAVFYPAPSVEDLSVGSRPAFVLAFLSCLPLGLLYSVAFAGSGLMLGLLLSSPTLDTRRLYFLDLVGSAVGAVSVIPALSLLGAERAAVVAGLALVLGTGLLFPPPAGRVRKACILAAAVLVTAMALPDLAFRLRYPRQSPLGRTATGDPRYVLEHVAWDGIARIEVSKTAPPDPDRTPWPALFGPDREMLGRFRLLITQNNNAYTYAPEYDGDKASLEGLRETIYAASYEATTVTRPRVLAIGVGGGIDVLTALRYDAAAVTGVEVNGATLGILRKTYADYFRPWVADPRVRLVHDDGRHYLASQEESFDVLQLSGVDSASGTPGAAHVFSESYLYTLEALKLYLARLTPAGVLNVMRPEYVPPRDMLRLLLTAQAALREGGAARPSDHLVVVTARNGELTSVLAQASPFSADQVRRIAAWTSRNPYLSLAAAPGFSPAQPNLYHSFLGLGTRAELQHALRIYPFDVAPVTDDRPFFFRTSRWSHVVPREGPSDPGPPALELGLLCLLAVCALAAFAFVYLPLRGLPGRPKTGSLAAGVYFSAIGFGYMALELALIQRFGLLLGHPNYALSVVLSSLLFATGIGSLLSPWVLRRLRGHIRFVAYVLILVLLAEYLLLLPRTGAWVAWSLASRVGVVVAALAPLGLLLGVFLPAGLDRLKQTAPAFVPWAWGINGMASVVAPVLGVAVSVTFGISALLLVTAPAYLLAGFVAPPPSLPRGSEPRS